MPDSPPFATEQELASLLRRQLDEAGATEAILAVSAEIRGATRQTITQATTEGLTLRPLSGALLVLPELPVDLDSVQIRLDPDDDDPVADVHVEPDTGLVWAPSGTCWPPQVTVGYTHGYEAGHPKLETARRVCLYAAARLYVNPEQTMQKRRDTYSASWGSSTVEVSGLTTWERQLLGRTYPAPEHGF